MKMANNISKYGWLLAAVMLICCVSCQKDFPKNIESGDEVVLQSIKIVNAGAAGNTVLEGTIDENKKTISFPRLDPSTNFDDIKFETVLSNGASLEKASYSFIFNEGESSKTSPIKVINNKRFREYFVTLRLNIPVFGADFGKPQIFDYTNNELGNPVYPAFVSMNTRWSGFDGENILIVTRATMGSHILKVNDIKQNNPQLITLSMAGISLSPFAGGIANGHSYMTNLASAASSKINLYHWASPTATPQLIYSISAAEIGAPGARHGDNMSVNLDKNGNGFIYLGDNNGGSTDVRDIIRLKITNYATVSEPTVLAPQPGITPYMTFNRVEGTDDYLLKGYAAPLRLVSDGGAVAYTLGSTTVPQSGADARVVFFNGERYLMMTTSARGGTVGSSVVLYVYDISRGSTTAEALALFNERTDKSPVYQYSLLGPVNTAPGTQTGWYVSKDEEGLDEKLSLFTASTDAGFVVIDFPKKMLED